MFEHEQYFMLLLPAIFLIGLLATIISVNILGRTDEARRTYCQTRVRTGKVPEPWCAQLLETETGGRDLDTNAEGRSR